MRTFRFLLGVLLVVAAPAWAAAQSTGATLAGVVFDQSNQALPGATVTIRQTETDAKRVVVTDGQGRYQAPALSPAIYEVTAELAGFQTSVRDRLVLTLGQTATVNFTLGIASLTEQVVVTESAPLVETTRGGVASLVDEQQIRDLPLSGRDFSQLTLLQPGVLASPTTAQSVDRGMGTQVSIAGARPNQISYLLDGADVNSQGNQAPGSAAGGRLGVETVREFQVLVNNYSAEYGRSTGGVVSAITRSGTNSYRGNLFEFTRNAKFDSKGYFDDPNTDIPPYARNQFGGILGGPLRKDHTFFFGSYEGLRQDRSINLVNRVPSRATRARTDINPAIAPYLAMYPLPNGTETGATGIYSTAVKEPTREDYVVGKIDQTVSNSDSLTLRYTFDDATVTTPNALPLFSDVIHTRSQFWLGEYKRVMTSHLLNELRFAYNKPYEETINQDNIPVDPKMFFIPGSQFGTINVTGLATLGVDTQTPTWVNFKSIQLIDNLTWTTGSHTVKAGVNWTRWTNDQDSAFTLGGNYSFTSVDNFIRGVANTFEGAVPGSTTARTWTQSLIGLFAQDDWTLSRRLTLNAGVRYEFITEPKEAQDRVAHVVSVLDKAPTVGYPLFNNPSLRNVAPRLGLAWDVFGDGKTSVRGGAGMFYEPILGNIYRAYGNRTPPFLQQANIRTPPFPNPFAGSIAVRNRWDLVDFNLKNPIRLQYNATLQREVLPQTVVQIGYLGSRGYHQLRNIEANQAAPVIQPDGSYFFPAGGTRVNTNVESVRLRLADGNSWYNGLIVGMSKRFSRGLSMQASYTLGKSTDEGSQAVGSGDFANSFQPRYGFDRHDNYGLSDFDVRHNFVFNYSYELPFTANVLLRGWQVSGLVSLRSGVPFSPVLGFDRARALPRSGGAGQRPGWAPGFDASKATLGGAKQYFDPTAFVLPAAGTFGNVARNALIGPGYASWDGAFIRNVAIGSRRRVQIRAEIFNILNRANFGLPAATVFDSAGRVEGAGEITTIVGTARQMQFGIKIEF